MSADRDPAAVAEFISGAPRLIGPGTRPAPRLWRWVWMVPIFGVGAALLKALLPWEIFELLHALALLAGLSAGLVLGSWLERFLAFRCSRFGGLARVSLALLSPPVLLVVFSVAGIVLESLLGKTGSDGFAAMMLFPAGLWAAGRALGSAVVEVIDVLVSAVVSTFRRRIMAAVSILVAGIGTGVGVMLGLVRGAVEALGEHPETIKAEFAGVDVSAWARAQVSAHPEIVTVLALALALLILFPALSRALDRLAEAVLERIEPLFLAFDAVAEGDRALRIEAGGSQEFVTLARRFNGMVEGLALSEQMERAFGRYVGPAVRDQIRAQHGDARLAPAEREATVFFADIRGFTTLCEQLEPAAVMALLNRYFERVVEVVDAHEGYLDKFIGDAVVVVFNGPIEQPDHLRQGLACAAALSQAVAAMNEAGAFEAVGGLAIGVGLATGPLVCGNLGAAGKLEYTVIGDTVNLASRVEGLCKRYGSPALATGFTAPPPGGGLREIDRVVVKGKQEAVSLFELLDALPPEERARRQATLAHFEAGRAALLSRRFDAAREAFARCAPDDGPAALHRERLETILREGVPEGWDGAHRFDRK